MKHVTLALFVNLFAGALGCLPHRPESQVESTKRRHEAVDLRGRDPVSLDAARLVVLALKASVGYSGPARDYLWMISPGQHTADAEETAASLAQLPKPIKCTPTADGALVRVSCDVLSGASKQGHENKVAVLELWWTADIMPRVKDASTLVLVLAGSDSVMVPAAAVQRWYQDYALPPSGSFSGNPPDEREGRGGARYVFVFSRADEVDPTPFLDTLSRDH